MATINFGSILLQVDDELATLAGFALRADPTRHGSIADATREFTKRRLAEALAINPSVADGVVGGAVNGDRVMLTMIALGEEGARARAAKELAELQLAIEQTRLRVASMAVATTIATKGGE